MSQLVVFVNSSGQQVAQLNFSPDMTIPAVGDEVHWYHPPGQWVFRVAMRKVEIAVAADGTPATRVTIDVGNSAPPGAPAP